MVTSATTALRPVGLGESALGIPAGRDRDHHVANGNEVFVAAEVVCLNELGASFVAELADDLCEFLSNDRALAQRAGKDVVVIGDEPHEFVVLINDLLALERGETTQLHVEDGRRLDLIDLQQRHQAVSCFLNGWRAADKRNDLVKSV